MFFIEPHLNHYIYSKNIFLISKKKKKTELVIVQCNNTIEQYKLLN